MKTNRRKFFATLAGFAAAPLVQPQMLKIGDRITIAGMNAINPESAEMGIPLRIIRTYRQSGMSISRIDANSGWAKTRPVDRFILEEQRRYNRHLLELCERIGGPDAKA